MRGFLPLLVAFLFLLGTACGFDRTYPPALPDEVLNAGQKPDGGQDPVCTPGEGAHCTRQEPQLEDFGVADGALTGTWARKLTLASETDSRENNDYKDSTSTVVELVTVLHRENTVREVVEVCGISMVVVDGAQNYFPQNLIDHMPILAEEGDFITPSNGTEIIDAAYQNPTPLVRLYGLTEAASEKEWERCDSYFNPDNAAEECPMSLWPEIFDMDCDCQVGITFQVAVGTADPADLYLVQRAVMTRTGTVESADRISGQLEYEELAAVLDAAMAMLRSNAPTRVLPDSSTFEMVRLSEGADCAAVMAKFPVE